jgi:hypothetical protein
MLPVENFAKESFDTIEVVCRSQTVIVPELGSPRRGSEVAT